MLDDASAGSRKPPSRRIWKLRRPRTSCVSVLMGAKIRWGRDLGDLAAKACGVEVVGGRRVSASEIGSWVTSLADDSLPWGDTDAGRAYMVGSAAVKKPTLR